MRTSTKAMLAAGVIMLIPVLLVAGYFFIYLPHLYGKEAMHGKAEEGHAQGSAYGRGRDQDTCLNDAVRLAGDKTLEVRSAGPWLYGCLESSTPSPGFCDGIGPPSEHPDFDRQRTVCHERGIKEYCLFYMPTVEAFCDTPTQRPNGSEARPPTGGKAEKHLRKAVDKSSGER